VKVPLS